MNREKPDPNACLCSPSPTSCTCSVTTVELKYETACDAFAAIVAGISWRFATDYNLVAEICLGEHRQWTESEKHHAS